MEKKNFGGIIYELVKIATNFSDLKDNIKEIDQRSVSNMERIAKLERGEQEMVEKTNAIIYSGLSKLETNYIERLVKLENAIDGRDADK